MCALVQASTRHASKYVACGQQCVDSIARFYDEEIKFFNFKAPPRSGHKAARRRHT